MFSSMIQNLLSSSGQASAMQRAVQMNNYVNSINSQWTPVQKSEAQQMKPEVVSFDKVLHNGAKVKFGDNVFIAPNCGFHTAGHPIDAERRNQGLEYAYPITVGDNVWIGAGVQVMPGVTIGSNVVIGGGSVVVKDIPSNVVAVGNPCRVVRPISDEDKLKSWDRE